MNNTFHPSDNPEELTLEWALGNLSRSKLMREFNKVCQEQDITCWVCPNKEGQCFDLTEDDLFFDLRNAFINAHQDERKYLTLKHVMRMLAWYNEAQACGIIKGY